MKKRLIAMGGLLLLLTANLYASESSLDAVKQFSVNIDQVWVLFSAALVFFMQAGFKALEAGLIKREHQDSIGMKNLIDWIVGVLAFFAIGFGFMFGTSKGGFIGTDFFFGSGLAESNYTDIGGIVFFLFQLGFTGTALTIVSGAMSGRTGLMPYLVGSVITAVFIYPIFGHWAWGNLFNPDNKAWLADMGFMDFAGSTVVHSVGAWISLVGVWIVGPRIGRFNVDGEPQPFKPSNYSYAILGVMILWLGWWGFNGGSTLALNADVGKIILNTNVAAATAGVTAFLHSYFIQKRSDVFEKLMGGSLTGLVAITASCNIVSPESSVMIGFLAGLVHNYSFDFLLKVLKLDDSVGAIPVHGFGGVLGTLSVAIFGKAELLALPRLEQLGIQTLGIIVCFGFTAIAAYVMFKLLHATVGLRVSPCNELNGYFLGNKAVTKKTIFEDLKKEGQLQHISVKVSEGGYNLLSLQEFMTVEPKDREILINETSTQYIDEHGKTLTKLEAVKQLNRIIDIELKETTLERDQVASKHQNVTDSIQYASRIQNAVLPSEEYVNEVLPEHFILNRPKDIVSGDYYWVAQNNGYTYLAVADCTGHGVPGAFMSMLGISILNEIVKTKPSDPGAILDILKARVIEALNSNDDSENRDGMDISLVVLDSNENTLSFAGAFHSMLYIKKNNMDKGIEGDGCEENLPGLFDIKGDRMPIGLYVKRSGMFTNHRIKYHEGDMFYLTSDGYVDQFGGPKARKFMARPFKELIYKNASLSMEQQMHIFENEYDKWKGALDQVDDVLVLGVRL